MMRTQIGQLFFALGTIVAIALAAKTPDWEAAQDSAANLSKQLGKGAVTLQPELNGTIPQQKAESVQKLLAQALSMEGFEVRDDSPRKIILRNPSANESGPIELLASVPHPTQAPEPVAFDFKRGWPATTAPWIVFALLACVGVLLWRSGAKRSAQAQSSAAHDESKNPFSLLDRLIPAAQQSASEVDTLECEDLRQRADALLEEYLLPLAEVRQRIIDRVGMKLGSEILVTVAYGERILNRVWSAAADGHLPEARACLPEAVDALVEAQRLAHAALESSQA